MEIFGDGTGTVSWALLLRRSVQEGGMHRGAASDWTWSRGSLGDVAINGDNGFGGR